MTAPATMATLAVVRPQRLHKLCTHTCARCGGAPSYRTRGDARRAGRAHHPGRRVDVTRCPTGGWHAAPTGPTAPPPGGPFGASTPPPGEPR